MRPLADALRKHGTAVWNLYGPTETAIYSTAHAVGTDDGVVPIGLPVAGTELHVLDRQMRPVPHGVAGELFIGGDGVATGYLNRPRLTAAAFVPNPFSTAPGARVRPS